MTHILEKNNGLDKIASTVIRRRYTDVAKLVKENKKPIEITVNGKADLVLMNLDFFEAIVSLLEDYDDQIMVLKHQLKPEDSVDRKTVFEETSLGEYESMSIEDVLNQ